MRTIKQAVYSYDELSEKSKEKVLNDSINFFLEGVSYENMSEEMKKACDRAERLHTPWFTGQYIFEYCKEEIEDFSRQYEYFSDGSIYVSK